MKYIEANVPDFLRVEVHHMPAERFNKPVPFRYVTIAHLRDRETGYIRATGVSRCSLKDTPSRKIGRAIAVGRALKKLHGIGLWGEVKEGDLYENLVQRVQGQGADTEHDDNCS